ncbi:MAG: DNA cytosine methyltransferase [Arcobacter sp.]|uniref:DNA cytosine methyltransferase n=1 Tax=Arcobacter sp. TaxID=1872629 RepID=UPI003C7968C7
MSINQYQFSLDFDKELIVDLFAGGGGASCGIEMALGVSPDIAINHDPEAIALHQENHPKTLHFINDVFEINPTTVAIGRKIGLLWLSPDCKHFSKAKGGKPKNKKIRSLAWVGIKWAKAKRPRVIILENVEEFKDWGPISKDGKVIEHKKGDTFKKFINEFHMVFSKRITNRNCKRNCYKSIFRIF